MDRSPRPRRAASAAGAATVRTEIVLDGRTYAVPRGYAIAVLGQPLFGERCLTFTRGTATSARLTIDEAVTLGFLELVGAPLCGWTLGESRCALRADHAPLAAAPHHLPSPGLLRPAPFRFPSGVEGTDGG